MITPDMDTVMTHTASIRAGVTLLTLCALLLALPGCGGGAKDSTTKTAVQWTCPMHPSVLSDRPGACPVCGMDLVKKSTEETSASAADIAMLRSVSLSPSQRVLANVATAVVQRRQMAALIGAAGVVDFAEPLRAGVAARFRGRVEKLHVDFTGAAVRRGQPLLDLYSPELIAAEEEYLIAVRGGGDDVQRRMAVSLADRLEMQYGLTRAQIDDLRTSDRVKRSITVAAPIGGTVLQRRVEQGQYVDEGTTLYQLADLSRVWVYLEIAEQDLRFISIGQQAGITTDAWPGRGFTGRVVFIDPVMDAETRTVRVRVELANPDGRLKPQMYVRGSISVPRGDLLAVPASAVLHTGTRDVAWVEVEQNRFEPRTLALGARAGDWYEVRGGLAAGEQVVVSGGFLLDSESALQSPELSAADTDVRPAPDADGPEKGGDGATSAPARSGQEVKTPPAAADATEPRPQPACRSRRTRTGGKSASA